MKEIQNFDTVALLNPISAERLTLVEPEYTSINSLPVGLVGTVVEVYNSENESKYLVEFADNQGQEYAMAILKADELIVLQYELILT
ncbi:DUF4926 domain-containing protein [Floridanema evergladense]|uniref:DUF4926 domain-containing protein n=1 Tax=Floridaenema evergladense BLCC-F167 TaxID=3153639 RepID=A0ABV4WXA4_9CYAN